MMWEVWVYIGTKWHWLVIGAPTMSDAIDPNYGVEFSHPSYTKLAVCQETDRPEGAVI
jgi:hypothetical protein